MRTLRLIFIAIFALFGGPLPAAAGDHVVICGADGETRFVSYDFETGQPIEVEITLPDCQDCFSGAPYLPPTVAETSAPTWGALAVATRWRDGQTGALAGLPSARGPPSLIV